MSDITLTHEEAMDVLAALELYVAEIDYQIEEVDHTPGTLEIWEGDREECMAVIKMLGNKLEVPYYMQHGENR